MARILIIDDEKGICTAIKDILEDEGYTADYALTFADGFAQLKKCVYDILFLDIWLPDKDGIDGLRDIKSYFPDLEVVIISGHGNIENAVEATRRGAYDFLEKPLSLERILLIVKHLTDKFQLMHDLRETRSDLIKKYDIIGVSRPINELKKKIEKIAPTNAWVMINGENGTGKEHVARLIHMLSRRAKDAFVEINCAAIPSELLETEMFGHEKGSFTGAVAQKMGKFEEADNGTVFLDEIGDMSMPSQAKLLRVLENNSFTRVGGNTPVKSDFRLITATNKNLEEEIEAGNFREDLYYRINVVPLTVPPLRERKEDIPILMQHFIREACSLNGLELKKVSLQLMELFMVFEWPGNVRQLKNLIERMVVLSEHETMDVEDAPDFLRALEEDKYESENGAALRNAKEGFEKQYILQTLQANDWNISQSAKILEIERTYLHRKIKVYGLEKFKPVDGKA
ncbi:sigma-54 dependent transcriptional regulator [Seleniivibrio sp.]|uniref:sigma-54-dependent transcriptional regulator n=1 Tax=Seleniivibrio sp. TaxID=2898801 RepID=UPI0025D7A03C|nr:sigma-54 dependent transcriptional regulator [Seleniivibrio sp.]MCD8553307.1 sigma-54 dependent transcriptional regulator [Seleniivibrio sp.]